MPDSLKVFVRGGQSNGQEWDDTTVELPPTDYGVRVDRIYAKDGEVRFVQGERVDPSRYEPVGMDLPDGAVLLSEVKVGEQLLDA